MRSIPDPPMRSTPPDPEPDTIWRSPASVAPATRQPSPVAPTRYASGTRTSSRNTSLKSTSPPMCRSGRTSTPGACRSTMKYVSPRRFGTAGSVRARQIAKSERCAHVVQTFWPLSTHSSPSRTARVASDARSDPAPGSLSSWHHFSSLRTSGGRNRRRCSSVPCANRAGAALFRPSGFSRPRLYGARTGFGDPRLARARGRGRRTRPARSRPRGRCRRTSGTRPRRPPGSAPSGSPPARRDAAASRQAAGTLRRRPTPRRRCGPRPPRTTGRAAAEGRIHRAVPYASGRRERRRDHRRRASRACAPEDRGRAAAHPAAALPLPERGHVPPRGRGLRRRQPAVGRARLRADHSLGRPDRVAAPGRRRHADRRGRGHRAPPTTSRTLLRGDPIRGAHAFYSGSSREWWAPLRPGRRVVRRNALVGVHDKSSDFAERAIHEWTAEVFASRDPDEVLSAQYRLMIRTDRTKAEERGKNDAIVIEPYTDDADRGDRRGLGGGAVAPAGQRAALVGGRRGGRRGRAAREGAAARHRHGLLARRDGHGALRREGAAARLRPAAARAAVLPARRPQHPRRAAARPLGSGVGAPGRATPRATTTAACARPGSSTSAPTGWATTRGSGSSTASSGSSTTSATPTGCAAGSRASCSPTATGRRSSSTIWGENQRGETTTPGHATILLPEPRARRGAAPGRAGRRDHRARTRSAALVDRFAARSRGGRVADEAVPDPAGRSRRRDATARCCASGSTGRIAATRSPTTSCSRSSRRSRRRAATSRCG